MSDPRFRPLAEIASPRDLAEAALTDVITHTTLEPSP